jgi:hypothetical protein
MQKLLIETATGEVANVILVAGNYQPPDGFHVAELVPGVGIGWRYDGETWLPPVPETPPQLTVTMAQARTALSRAGLLASVEAAVNTAGGETLIAWEYSTTVTQDSALVTTLSAALNLTPEMVAGLFAAASEITF